MALLRLLLVAVLALSSSGALRAVAAEEACCEEPCGGAPDGDRCPPNCDQGLCGEGHVSLAAAPVRCGAPTAVGVRAARCEQDAPPLPVVTDGPFQPPRG